LHCSIASFRGRSAAQAYLECILRAPAKPEIRLRYSILLDEIPRNEILSVWATSVSQKYSRYRISSLTSMRYTYLGVSQLRYGISAPVVSVTIIKQTTQHNTLLSRWPISAIKRVPLYSPDGQYRPSGESTVCGWPISAVNGLCFLLMADIAHQQRDTPSQRLLSAIGRVYHPPDG
jgi:hypothetical protein